MKSLALVLSFFFVGCGDCIPSSVTSPASFSVGGAPAQTIAVAHSADELRAALANAKVSSKENLDAFVAGTSFVTTDVALVRAGGERARLAGAKTDRDRVTLYFTGQCSPCAGGDPGSYYEAAAEHEAAHAERTELVRVPKGARVDVRVCATSCGQCPTNVP